MATSGSLTTSAYSDRSIKFSWEQSSQSIANNTTTIKWSLTGAGSASGFYKAQNITLKIDGKVIFQHLKDKDGQINLYNGTVIATGTYTLAHNSDGSNTFAAFVEAGIYNWAPNCSGSKSFTLEKIPRQATITSAPNFTDEANPVVKYSNPAGSAVEALDVAIYDDTGTTAYAAYRAANVTGTSYTFELTGEERLKLRNAIPNANSMTVKFYLRTKIGGKIFYSSVSKTLTIAEPNPICEPTIVDTGVNSIAYTGDANNVVIKGFNTMNITFGASAIKGATITSQKVVCGGKSLTTDGKLNNVESGTFVFTITDSRGNTTTKTITKTLINYFNPTIKIKSINLTTDGVLNYSLSGKVWVGSFGATANTYNLRYRYKVSGGSWGSWTTTTFTPGSDGSYSVNKTISGLDYKKTYVFQAMVRDTVHPADSTGIQTPEKTVTSYPIFDWSGEDFNFNVPVSFQGNVMTDFVIEQGTEAMGTNGTWYWRKWASGRADCYGCRNFGNMAVSTAWGGLYRSSTFTQSLPTGLFNSTPEMIDIVFRHSNYGAWIAKHETSAPSSTDSGSFIVVRPASATLSQAYISFNVIGRWK